MKAFEQSLPMMMHRALNAVMAEFRRIFARFGVTERQWRVLRLLWDADGRHLASLAEGTLIPAPSLVGVIDRLEARGLVERQRSDQDRRVVQVWLTPAGFDLKTAVTPLVDETYTTFESLISTEEWRSLATTLDKIADRAPQPGKTAASAAQTRTGATP